MHPDDTDTIARINAQLDRALEFPKDRRPTVIPWLFGGIALGMFLASWAFLVHADPIGGIAQTVHRAEEMQGEWK